MTHALHPVDTCILSVNVSGIRPLHYQNDAVYTGILKSPAHGRVAVRGVNLHGDDQADRSVHGGPDRALYAYAIEDYRWWATELGQKLPAGKFGENLTLQGVDVSGALIGERWRAGNAVLKITAPRLPCYKLAMTMGDAAFVKRFSQAGRPGAYLSIVAEGDLAAGDDVAILSRPAHGLTIAAMFHIVLFERGRLPELLVPDLPSSWRVWVEEQLAHS